MNLELDKAIDFNDIEEGDILTVLHTDEDGYCYEDCFLVCKIETSYQNYQHSLVSLDGEEQLKGEDMQDLLNIAIRRSDKKGLNVRHFSMEEYVLSLKKEVY